MSVGWIRGFSMPKPRAYRKKPHARKGQSEIIGGLIVLTLLFAFAVPLILNSYYSNIQTGARVQENLAATQTSYNEKLTVVPVNPNSIIGKIAYPGVFINNTGTIPVTVSKVILIDTVNNSVFAILDMRYARNGTDPLVYGVLVNVTGPLLTGAYQPPYGEPIILQPGESMLLMFNKSLASIASNILVLVETGRGLLQPNGVGAGGGAGYTLAGTQSSQQTTLKGSAWRGIYAPTSGFILRGAQELEKQGNYYTWTPPYFITLIDRWGDPTTYGFASTFIYDDNEYPGLYKITWEPDSRAYIYIMDTRTYTYDVYTVYSGDYVEIYGFVGSYDTGSDGQSLWISGFTFKVVIDGVVVVENDRPRLLGTRGITTADIDGNGVSELVFYSLLNGPTISNPTDVDADDFADIIWTETVGSPAEYDSPVWTYMVARDIAGVNFIRVNAKINYYWTDTFLSSTSCPNWNFRKLKLFSIVVWKYNKASGQWQIYQTKDFMYTNSKPYQFQVLATFPVDANGTYRVGILFYDNYRSWEGYGYHCWKDFTFGLEHLIIEYGVYNPLFKVSPPVYIVAIPNPSLIKDIGEQSYSTAYNVSLTQAKLEAQAKLVQIIENELNTTSISGYTVVTDQNELCNLLFSQNPPKYAIVVWLQGSKSIYSVTRGHCNIGDRKLAEYIAYYHWVWVWMTGKPFGNPSRISTYNIYFGYTGPGNYTGNLTSYGKNAKSKALLWYLFDKIPFRYLITTGDTDYIVNSSMFYTSNQSGTIMYGTTGFWEYNPNLDIYGGEGIVVVNPVMINWTYPSSIWLTWNPENKTEVPPWTAVEAGLYSGLYAWSTLTGTS